MCPANNMLSLTRLRLGGDSLHYGCRGFERMCRMPQAEADELETKKTSGKIISKCNDYFAEHNIDVDFEDGKAKLIGESMHRLLAHFPGKALPLLP